MRKHAVIVVDESSTMVVHVLNTPDFGEPGFYRQATSLNAFFFSDKMRNQSPEALFVCHPWHEFESCYCGFDYKVSRTFDSIWEFYKFIGYDYKSKRYTPS